MNYDLLIDLHKGNKRQGPGGDGHTRCALELSGLDRVRPLLIADVGCGTGSLTLTLAESLNASIVAIDLFERFLDVLSEEAQRRGVADKIKTAACSMEDLPFESSFAGFLSRHDSDDARAIVEAERLEIALYRRFSAFYSCGFYIAQKVT